MLYNLLIMDDLPIETTMIILGFFIVLIVLFIHLIFRWYNLYYRKRELTRPKEPKITLKKIATPKFKLMPGSTYMLLELTDKNMDQGFKIFKNMLQDGAPGLLITRTYPAKVKKKFALGKLPIIWLTRTKSNNSITPTNLGNIVEEIKEFTSQQDNSVVMFDGLEYLTVHNEFPRVLKFLHTLKDEIALNNARLMISLNPKTLSKKKIALMGKELKVLNPSQDK